MKKKVAIMSMQRVVNYGSYMQAKSLKRILEELGFTVEFVDYKVEPSVYERSSFVWLLKRSIIWKAIRNIRIKQDKSYIELKKIYEKSLEEIGVKRKTKRRYKADLLIIGSDEVFNCTQSNPDVGYSLELFGKDSKAKKTATYAASFGNTTFDKLVQHGKANEIARYLSSIDFISVRDKNSFDIVANLTGIEPEIHFDPVLVGNIETEINDDCNLTEFVAVYGYWNRFSKNEGEAIKQFAMSHNLKIVSLFGKQSFCDQHIVIPPKDVLAYFKHAEYVITDTFHGVIFSVIMQKKFAFFARENNSEKVLDLLVRLGLIGRTISELNELGDVLEKEIDYESVNRIRMRERKRAKAYLSSILK